MKKYISNIEKDTLENDNFRKVVSTTEFAQLVLMNLVPNEEIGEEIHDVDQFFRFESGEGKVVIDGIESIVGDGFAVIVPAGSKHNVINTSSDKPLKLYTIYTPPHHRDGVIHKTKIEAESDTTDHL